MEFRDIFLFFGISAAVLAVVVSIVGLRAENFPSQKQMFGLLAVAFILVVGTGFYAVEFSVEESKEREEHSKEVIGEEASVTPLRTEPTA